MIYKQFLISQLLRDLDINNENYNILPYDILWDLSFKIVLEFDIWDKRQENSVEYLDDLYQAITFFIKDNREYLIKLCEKNI